VVLPARRSTERTVRSGVTLAFAAACATRQRGSFDCACAGSAGISAAAPATAALFKTNRRRSTASLLCVMFNSQHF